MLRKIKRNMRCFGWRGIGLALREVFSHNPVLVQVRSPHLGHKVWIRVNTTDISIYHQMFVEREYEIALSAAPRIIVDAGANVGFSAIFFAKQYPGARIVALEPERSNFEVLSRNLAGYQNVEAIAEALWCEVARLQLFDPGNGRAGLQKDGFQTFSEDTGLAVSSGTVPAVDLDTLMARADIDFIDLLKIDIEGAEREVFNRGGKWLDRVGAMTVELHDRMRPGCSRAFYNATAHFPVELYRGENVIVAQAGRIADRP